MSARAEAVKALHARGARLCRFVWDEKAQRKKAYRGDAKDMCGCTLAEALAWADDKWLAIIPGDLGLAVVDQDHGGEAAREAVHELLPNPLHWYLTTEKPSKSHTLYPVEKDVPASKFDWQHGEVFGPQQWAICRDFPGLEAKVAESRSSKPGNPIYVRLTEEQLKQLPGRAPTGAGAAPMNGAGAAPMNGKAENWSPGSRNKTLHDLSFLAARNGDTERLGAIKQSARDAGLTDAEIENTVASAIKGAESKGTRKFIANARTAQGLSQALDAIGVDLRLNVRARRYEYRIRGQWLEADDERTAWVIQVIQARCSAKSATKDKETGQYTGLKYSPETFHHLRLALGNNARVDPFLEKLQNLPAWDGVERIDTLLCEMFDAEDTPLVRWASRYAGMAGVQRALEPGGKLDEVPVLLGEQGCGKSAFIRCWLEDAEHEWHGDGVDLAARPKEQAEQMAGRVLVELSELTGMRKAEVERLKSFITRRDDGQFRWAYARSPVSSPRMVALMGTTNEPECLPNDPSGNRRFIVVELPKGCDVERASAGERVQWWAEALARYQAGERANLPRTLLHDARETAERHRSRDSLEEEVRGALAALRAHHGEAGFTVNDLHKEIYGDGTRPAEKPVQMRLSAALRNIGCTKRRGMRNGAQLMLWTAPASDVPVQEPEF